MRCVRGARCVVRQPRFVGSYRVQQTNAVNGVVGHILIEEIVFLVVRRFDGFNVLEQRRSPLAGVAAEETVEVLEAKPAWPQIKRPGLTAVPVWDIVVLAIPSSVVAVLLEHLERMCHYSSA